MTKGERTIDIHNYPERKVAGTSTLRRVGSTQINWILISRLTGH